MVLFAGDRSLAVSGGKDIGGLNFSQIKLYGYLSERPMRGGPSSRALQGRAFVLATQGQLRRLVATASSQGRKK